MQQASLYKTEQQERAKREQQFKETVDGGIFDEEANEEDAETPAEKLIKSGLLPLSSQEYLDKVTQKIDTSQLMEIVQVFCHKQNMQSSGRATGL